MAVVPGAMRRVFVVLALAALAACAGPVPLADKQSDDAGKRFDPPPAGLATLYLFQSRCSPGSAQPVGTVFVYHPGSCGRTPLELIHVGGKLGGKVESIGTLDKLTWVAVNVPPGTYEVRCAVKNQVSALLAVDAGEQAFLQVSPVVNSKYCAVSKVSPDHGRRSIMDAQRIAGGNR
jgi:hypothetical protein